jgi:hypothetical protein
MPQLLVAFNPKTEVAARERKERKARRMNDENEDHKNGGRGNLQIPFFLCPLRSFAAIQFRSPGLTRLLAGQMPVIVDFPFELSGVGCGQAGF